MNHTTTRELERDGHVDHEQLDASADLAARILAEMHGQRQAS